MNNSGTVKSAYPWLVVGLLWVVAFLNYLSTIIGGGMVYVAGALKDARIDLSIAYQIMAVVMLFAAWSLLMVKIKKK